jgi:hypothetical protein
VLGEAGEAVGDAVGGAAIEAEHRLVATGLKVLFAHGMVAGAGQPALGEAEGQVHGG